MSREKKSVKVKGELGKDAVVSVLEDLLASFKEGQVCVASDGRFVALNPGAEIEVELEASTRKNRQWIEIGMSWRKAKPVEDEAAALNFKISSEAPEPEPEVTISDEVQGVIDTAQEAVEDVQAAVEEA